MVKDKVLVPMFGYSRFQVKTLKGEMGYKCIICTVKGDFCSWSVLTNRSYPFPKRQILDSSKMEKFADDNSKFDESSPKG